MVVVVVNSSTMFSFFATLVKSDLNIVTERERYRECDCLCVSEEDIVLIHVKLSTKEREIVFAYESMGVRDRECV